MKSVHLIDHRHLDFNLRGQSAEGTAYVARALDTAISSPLGVGFARWEGAKVNWTLLYDEVIFVLEGCLELIADQKAYQVYPGQMLWLPEGTELTYGGHAVFSYVVHPGNWKEIHGLT